MDLTSAEKTDVEFSLSRMFYDKYVDAKRDREFLQEFMKAQVSRRTIYAFVNYLEESAISIVDYADIILQLCENVLQMEVETSDIMFERQLGSVREVSRKLMER